MAGEFDSEPSAVDTYGALVESARRGDKDALGHLLSKYQASMLALCRKILGDTGLSDDAAQETGLLVILNIDHLRQPASFQAWLYGIALNVCHRFLQERRREAGSLEDWLDGKSGQSQVTWCGAKGEVDQADSLRYYPKDREAGFALLCTAKPRSNLRIRTHAAAELREYRSRMGLPAPRAAGI